MIDQSHMRFFVEPAINQTHTSNRILVLDTYNKNREEQYIGKIVNVKPEKAPMRGRAWNTTESGDYVFGAHLSDGADLVRKNNLASSGYLLAPYGDGFVVGMQIEMYREDRLRLRNVRFSNPGPIAANRYATVTVEWATPAASWSYELMPMPTDTPEMVAGKLALAQEYYKQRRAFNHLHEESVSRGWGGTMEELREKNDLIPAARYSATIEANIFIPVPRSTVGGLVANGITETIKANLPSAEREQDLGTVVIGATIRRSFPMRGTFATAEELSPNALSHSRVDTSYRQSYRNTGGTVTQFDSSVHLAGLAN